MCTQQRLRSAWASAQSDQSLRCPHEETLSLATHWAHSKYWALPRPHRSFCWFCHAAAHFSFSLKYTEQSWLRPLKKPPCFSDSVWDSIFGSHQFLQVSWSSFQDPFYHRTAGIYFWPPGKSDRVSLRQDNWVLAASVYFSMHCQCLWICVEMQLYTVCLHKVPALSHFCAVNCNATRRATKL